jgi:hypothetical protein
MSHRSRSARVVMLRDFAMTALLFETSLPKS